MPTERKRIESEASGTDMWWYEKGYEAGKSDASRERAAALPPTDELPMIEKLSTGMLHRVYAGGDASDGSLYGFNTLCGQRIGENWEAEWKEHRACERCAKALRAAAPQQEERTP